MNIATIGLPYATASCNMLCHGILEHRNFEIFCREPFYRSAPLGQFKACLQTPNCLQPLYNLLHKNTFKGCYCNFFQTSYFCKHTCKDTLKLPFQIYIYNVFFQELELPGMLRYHTIRFSLLSHGNLTFIKHLLLKQHSSTGTIHQTRNIKKCD